MNIFQQIIYYIQNWNTDVLSMGITLAIILMISGYFWGRFLQKFIKPIRKVDATFLGVFIILAVNQIVSWRCVSMYPPESTLLYNVDLIAVLAGPILCLVCKANVVPSWKHLASLCFGILIAAVLGTASSKMTTNNIYYDSVYYMSEVLESSTDVHLGAVNYYTGIPIYGGGVDKFHDFEGYYHLWGMLIRFARKRFDYTGIVTPVFIWGASVLYWMSLGNLFVSSVNVLFKKHKWFGAAASLLCLSPFYSNYFNTTLAFFGNTLRTVIIGWLMLSIYLYMQTKNSNQAKWVFIIIFILNYAVVSTSSSGLFIALFACIGLFFWMAYSNVQDWQNWLLFIISLSGLIRMGFCVISANEYNYWHVMTRYLLITVVLLILIVSLLRKHTDVICRIGKVLLPVFFAGLVGLSFLNRNSALGYSYYFAKPSLHDMSLNYTSHDSPMELIRNIVTLIMVGLLFADMNWKKQYKYLLSVLIALFLTPLTMPAVAKYMTSTVYSRSFDLIINPFNLVLLVANADHLLGKVNVNWAALPLLGAASLLFVSIPTLNYVGTGPLYLKEDGYEWKTKVASDIDDMYRYIRDNLSGDETSRPVILSQDAGLKAYVEYIITPWSSSDFRNAMADQSMFDSNYDLVTLMYPDKVSGDTLVVDPSGISHDADYTKLSKVISTWKPDYVLLRNTIAVWNEKGWYEESYANVVNSGQCIPVYENESWILLGVDHSWQKAGKNDTRYWVHRIGSEQAAS